MFRLMKYFQFNLKSFHSARVDHVIMRLIRVMLVIPIILLLCPCCIFSFKRDYGSQSSKYLDELINVREYGETGENEILNSRQRLRMRGARNAITLYEAPRFPIAEVDIPRANEPVHNRRDLEDQVEDLHNAVYGPNPIIVIIVKLFRFLISLLSRLSGISQGLPNENDNVIYL